MYLNKSQLQQSSEDGGLEVTELSTKKQHISLTAESTFENVYGIRLVVSLMPVHVLRVLKSTLVLSTFENVSAYGIRQLHPDVFFGVRGWLPENALQCLRQWRPVTCFLGSWQRVDATVTGSMN